MLRLPVPLNIIAISRLNEIPRNTRGVYFIIRNTDVTYVGQTMACVFGRIKSHTRALETATHAAWYECDVSRKAKGMEEELIFFWHPEFNRQLKATEPPWEAYRHPNITRKPDFLEEYAKAVMEQYTMIQGKLNSAFAEISYYDGYCREVTIKNEELAKRNRQRSYQNTVLNKRLTHLREDKRKPSSHPSTYPYIGGVIVSTPEPLFLWHSPQQVKKSPSSFVIPSMLPVWLPGHGRTLHPRRSLWIWQRIQKSISRALFGLVKSQSS